MLSKKQSIESIGEIRNLSQIIYNICIESGLLDVNIVSDTIISAIEKGRLKDSRIIFILTLSELNSKVPQVLELVRQQVSKADEIIIISSSSKGISSYFKNWISKEANTDKIDFWDQTKIIEYIDKQIPHYWGHNDLFLKNYEEKFLSEIVKDVELKTILKLDTKFDSLLNVFIEPKIYIFKEDKETERTTRVRVNLDRLLKNDNFFISGDAGTGKSTLLKQIGKKIIEQNQTSIKRTLPIFIKPSDLQQFNCNLLDAINKKLLNNFIGLEVDKIHEGYHLLILIDSIDEFEKDNKKLILEQLESLKNLLQINFIITTRNYENLIEGCETCDHHQISISNFDQRQVKMYLDHFFKFDLAKSNDLWDNLQENRILDKIPPTPLTISLVSILYEEKQYEIPATITDVYDNFNQFLLGRLTVKSSLEFLDVNIKERVLSIYALEVIKTPNRKRKDKGEFIEFIKDFFRQKSITIKDELIPELLNKLTEGTGILYLDDKGYINFKHDHFMEYYASREIFIKHNRTELETELINKFTEHNWQNTVIFYTGRTKDMPEFLENLINRVQNYSSLNDCLLGVSGLGYVLQSLWMTDSKIREKGVITGLDLLLKADSRVKQLAYEKVYFFDGIRDIDIAFMNLVWFFNHYNSLAIRDPLNLAFDSIYEELKNNSSGLFSNDKKSRLYQLFCIASTLNSGRNADSTKLEILFDQQGILNDAFFVLLFEESSKILNLVNSDILKINNKVKNKFKKYIHSIRFYLDTSAQELRFTTFDKLIPLKDVEIYTEGKTDSALISHSFYVLTKGEEPYWNISSMDKVKTEGGGANDLRKHLEGLGKTILTEYDKSKLIIGIFDNDNKGCQEFGGLDKDFLPIHNRLKKHKNLNIYAIKLPIPDGDRFLPYVQEKQEFKFFSIEHYLPFDLLNTHNMVRETSIPGVYEIIGKKTAFSNDISKIVDEEVFKEFSYLFREIDEICKKNITYLD